MTSVAPVRRRRAESFRIHEDVPSTEDTEMNDDVDQQEGRHHEEEQEQEEDEEQLDEPHEEQESEFSSSEDEIVVDANIQHDMEKLQSAFPGFRNMYRLIKRIGEGTFSTVYKAEDLVYDQYDNSWDMEKENEKWTAPLKSFNSQSSTTIDDTSQTQTGQTQPRRRRPKYVAIKKIYVTSSPTRILNELELLHVLRNCPSVCPLITAFRQTDQVIAILPYFRHADFREYFRKMTVPDMAIYLRCLFTALSSVHSHNILHRDIKPTNFLYDPVTRRGVLVDFGLAEREGGDRTPCACHEDPLVRKTRLRAAHNASSAPNNGYPKGDTRPSRRANRAGTRGFRAPEVLFKCTEQTTKIDIWSVGVILLTILSRRFPFFNSADDVEALIEIATIFGQRRMRAAGVLHGCMLETTIPTIGMQGFNLERIILWSTCRSDTGETLSDDEKKAVEFLNRCLDLDPSKRISAEEALEHDFLKMGMDETTPPPGAEEGAEEEDEMDMIKPVDIQALRDQMR
ncbi:kinase-like domain-containing protein [Apodospora peruviana]|uniref:non-specific serine/threonine protein kinase n=1 Tax=Apodospora peruviana TaxID=516989 RepID=A0AAE0HWX4_9PEZI|nr:kinase-like domain-containing protein [Apodospora peruviana]